MKIDPKKLDMIANMEVDALIEGLSDPELRQHPAFLARVRAFLKENSLTTSPETAEQLERVIKEIPNFKVIDGTPLEM